MSFVQLGRAVTREELQLMTPPPATQTYHPLSYSAVVDVVETSLQRRGEDYDSRFGLSPCGNQFFGAMTLKREGAYDLTVALRQSYNKSLALGIAGGTSVTVCDNLCFSGNAFKVVRKNTLRVFPDFRELVERSLDNLGRAHAEFALRAEAMKLRGVSEEEGAQLIGLAQYQKILTSTQGNIARAEWRESDRHAWGLYNAFTFALKRGPVGTVITRHIAADTFLEKVCSYMNG